MSPAKVSPIEAKRFIDTGGILIDIRGADEYAREGIPNARNHPLGELSKLTGSAAPGGSRRFFLTCPGRHATAASG
ncbi:MAG: hypothetical protein K8F92_06360 [Hyphomicrobium sp.]|uniref:rhodanese-like domain-containing protein n=1 Tax=Hyphomicrobium sp. TaxID=82 RepID=UPI001327FC25|nr:rhodanese-like domain-containing protein [Hyphomicrobium sp.]KAB2942301.1 MAG: hypothetical protein F9K20_07125 [Hyphomicrobium sp.]MBZ0209257.1 hypothetical protein [Hyphomicrobium sp.]